jgi:hypothetical protein
MAAGGCRGRAVAILDGCRDLTRLHFQFALDAAHYFRDGLIFRLAASFLRVEPNLRCPRLDANLNLEKRGLKISRGGLTVDLCMYGRVRASYLTGWQFLEHCTIPRVVFRHL